MKTKSRWGRFAVRLRTWGICGGQQRGKELGCCGKAGQWQEGETGWQSGFCTKTEAWPREWWTTLGRLRHNEKSAPAPRNGCLQPEPSQTTSCRTQGGEGKSPYRPRHKNARPHWGPTEEEVKMAEGGGERSPWPGD